MVSSVCAAVIASPFAVALSGRHGTPFLGWPHEFDAIIAFASVFLSVLPIFLGYYHLSWFGALLSLAVSAVTCFAARFFAVVVFAFELVGHSTVLETATYVSACLLLTTLVFAGHMKASHSRTIRTTQDSLHLVSLL